MDNKCLEGENMSKLRVKTIVNEEHNIAAYHITNEKAETVDLFVYDHNINQKYHFFNENPEFEIFDISPCGQKILTITDSFVKKERKTKIFDIKSGEVLFETRDFFGYEALFTPKPNLILVRGDIQKKSNKVFVYDTEKKEVLHIMKGEFCLEYGGNDEKNQTFVYPNSKKKDEILVFDFHTLTERSIALKEKCKVQTVLPLKQGEYFVINEKMDAMKIDEVGNISWKTNLDFDELYFAPGGILFEDEIIFDMYEHIRLNLETGEITEKEKKVKGRLSKYFGALAVPFGEGFKAIDLKTREVRDIEVDGLKVE